MRLDIRPEVFSLGDALTVIGLLELDVKQRHDWRPSLPVAMAAEKFVLREVPALREFIEKKVIEAADPAPPVAASVTITLHDLADLLDDLRKPAILVVENRLGDGEFVRVVAGALGDQRLVDALNRDLLRFSNGGGCGEMVELAADECKVFRKLIRVMVLFDSDRQAPEQPSPHHDKVEEIRAAGVPEVHLLTWREMENYVPFRVWWHHFPKRRERIERLKAMLPSERGYRDLKYELGGKKRKMPKPLFPAQLALAEQDFAELGDGVVDELRELLARIHRIL